MAMKYIDSYSVYSEDIGLEFQREMVHYLHWKPSPNNPRFLIKHDDEVESIGNLNVLIPRLILIFLTTKKV